MATYKLLTVGNPKTAKGRARGYLSHVLHFAPAKLSGFQVCPKADSCAIACLNTAGRGGIFRKGETTNKIQECRIRRTRMFFEHRAEFMSLLVADVERGIVAAEKEKLIPTFRLNGTSDIAWEKIRCTRAGVEYRSIMLAFPDVIFYDYTKIPGRMNLPDNYTLTFSRSETNGAAVGREIAAGRNVAAVFRKGIPVTWGGAPCVNGDLDDLRFLDARGVIVGLKAKGRARHDTSGFILPSEGALLPKGC